MTTYTERFTHAVAVLCGAQPPADMVAEWIANIDVNSEHRLQSWVLCQAATPSWAQGIVVLDAAHVLANDPEEGEGHEERPPAQPAPVQPVKAMHIGWDYLDNGQMVATYAVPVKVQMAPDLYTTPPSAPVPLTDEQILNLAENCTAQYHDLLSFGRAIEAKLKEKNT
jgi:hypothetical protein